jgi:hypothetical protein
VTDFVGKSAPGNILEVPNPTVIIEICCVPNDNNDQTLGTQLEASNRNVTQWEEPIDFIENHCGLKAPYCLTVIYRCNLMQVELDEEYM